MKLSTRRRLVLMALVCGLVSACSATRIGPVETTFERASVRIPENVVKKFNLDLRAVYDRIEAAAVNDARPNYNKARLDLLTSKLPPDAKLPVIAYFHGCAGMLMASMQHLDWLAKQDDFVVVAPDSFARARPHYCFGDYSIDPSVWRSVTLMRRNEINYALDQLAKLPWVDKHNIFLMGHSQGGGLIAGYKGPVKIRGRIILNGGCNPGLGGDGMQDDEALLTFDTGRDPWFFNNYTTHCRTYVANHPYGQSVYEAESRTHNLVMKYWPTVKAFLTDNRR